MVHAAHLDQSFMQIPAKPPPQVLSQPGREDRAMFQLSSTKPLQGAQLQPWPGIEVSGSKGYRLCRVRGMSEDLQSALWITSLLLVPIHSNVPVTPGLV